MRSSSERWFPKWVTRNSTFTITETWHHTCGFIQGDFPWEQPPTYSICWCHSTCDNGAGTWSHDRKSGYIRFLSSMTDYWQTVWCHWASGETTKRWLQFKDLWIIQFIIRINKLMMIRIFSPTIRHLLKKTEICRVHLKLDKRTIIRRSHVRLNFNSVDYIFFQTHIMQLQLAIVYIKGSKQPINTQDA